MSTDTPPAGQPFDWRQIALLGVFTALDTGTQLAFKWGADGLTGLDFGLEMLRKGATLPGVWVAILGYIATFFVWMAILRVMPLSRAFPMTGLVYITVPLLAWLAFGETIGLVTALGIGLIMVGTVLIGMPEKDGEDGGIPSPTI